MGNAMNKTVFVVVGIIFSGVAGLLILTSNSNRPQTTPPEDEEPPIAEELSVTGSVDQEIAYGQDMNDLQNATENDSIKPFGQQPQGQQVQGQQTQQQQGQQMNNGQPDPPRPKPTQ